MATDKWMQRAFSRHKGALHKDLGVPLGEPIPRELLLEAAHHPERFRTYPMAQKRLRMRAWAALNAGKARRRRKR